MPGSQLSEFENHFKIKLKANGYRLFMKLSITNCLC